MGAIKRFFYVRSKASSVAHRAFARHPVEGVRTQCGRYVPKGWAYWTKGSMDDLTVCKRCGA